MAQAITSLWQDVVPRIDGERCRRCDECTPMVVCVARGIRRDGPGSLPVVNPDVCFGCYSCAGACRHRAIILPRR